MELIQRCKKGLRNRMKANEHAAREQDEADADAAPAKKRAKQKPISRTRFSIRDGETEHDRRLRVRRESSHDMM